MASRKRPSSSSLPVLLAELTAASWETIMRRTAMMAGNACSRAEYRRMVREKTAAARETRKLLLARPGVSAAALLKPWHGRASANAKRLRKG